MSTGTHWIDITYLVREALEREALEREALERDALEADTLTRAA